MVLVFGLAFSLIYGRFVTLTDCCLFVLSCLCKNGPILLRTRINYAGTDSVELGLVRLIRVDSSSNLSALHHLLDGDDAFLSCKFALGDYLRLKIFASDNSLQRCNTWSPICFGVLFLLLPMIADENNKKAELSAD